MCLLLASIIFIGNLVTASTGSSEGVFCEFVTQELFSPDSTNISETSRCGDLSRVISMLTVFETSVAFSIDAKIRDCTSPVVLRSIGREGAENHATSSVEDVVTECAVGSDSDCVRLFFHLRQGNLDLSDLIINFPSVISPGFLNISTARVAGCNANSVENLSNSSETLVLRENYSRGPKYVGKYLNHGRSIISLKIHQNRLYAHSFNTSIRSLVRTLLISNVNASSLLPHNLLTNLTDLEHFDVSYNGLHSLPGNLFRFNKMLLNCDLSNNLLQSIPHNLFKYNTKLKNLKADNNRLETLPPELFANNREIEKVLLDHNRLIDLPSCLFANNFKINIVILNENYLTQLPRDIFPRNSTLVELNLSRNRMRSINLTLLDDPTEKTIGELARFGYLRRLLFIQTENRSEELAIDRNTLVKTNHLIALNLSHNYLTNFPNDVFARSQVLRFLDASNNPGIRRFTNSHFLYSLEIITLTDSNIRRIEAVLSNSIYSQISVIQALEFSRNKIKRIDGAVFRNCRILEIIFLKDNLLENIEAGLFRDLVKLHYLDLSGNMLQVIPFEVLTIPRLLHLNVSRNRLRSFDPAPLIPLLQYVESNLQELDISRNCLTSSKISSSNISSSAPLSLIYGNFEFNALVDVPAIPTGQKMFHLRFGNNAIKTIEAKNLVFRSHPRVRFQHGDLLREMPENVQISVCPNPIKKICETNHQSCQDVTQDSLDRLTKNLPYVNIKPCNDSLDTYANNVSSVLRKVKFRCPFVPTCSKEYYQSFLCEDNTACDLRSRLLCPVTALCPPPCECYKEGVEQRTVVNCSEKRLTDLPPFVPPNTEVLHFQHNKLKNLSRFGDVIWKGLIEINLDYNEIEHANLSYLPSAIARISLKYNRVQAIVIESLGNLKIWLGGNPFLCDCNAVVFKTLASTSKIIADGKDILCTNSNHSIIDTSEEEMCVKKPKRVSNASLAIAMGILVPTFVGIILAAYYRNKRTVVAYLFSHHPRIFACFYSSDELVEDGKSFDAFISYSGTDTPVVKQFIQQLEEKEPYLKLCIHERDWIPGEEIARNIASSVCLSRKTVLILSKEFLESIWFSVELRSAYYQSVEDKVNRLIVVLRGDVPSLDDLDEDLRVLLKTKTYLIWGERWFWEKLRYALSRDT